MKIAFTGQTYFYDPLVGADLDDLYDEVVKYDIRPDFHDTHRFDVLRGQEADVWICVRGEFIPTDVLESMRGIKVWLSTEPVERSDVLQGMEHHGKNRFDYHFHYDRSEIAKLMSHGHHVAGAFPHPISLTTFKPYPALRASPDWDGFFAGRETEKRSQWLGLLCRDFNPCWVRKGFEMHELAYLMNRCRVGLNVNIDTYPQYHVKRLAIMAACGLPILTDVQTHYNVLRPGPHMTVVPNDAEFRKKFRWMLANPADCEAMAERARQRVVDLLGAPSRWPQLIDHVTGRGPLPQTIR